MADADRLQRILVERESVRELRELTKTELGVIVFILTTITGPTRPPEALRGALRGPSGGGYSVPELWLSGAAGGVIVFVLTTITGMVVRTVQRGRELRGLSRVLWPEMKRNWKAIGVLRAGGFDPNAYRGEHPTRHAWVDTRVRLSQLMPEPDFAILAKFYDDLEMLDAAVTRGDPLAKLHLDAAAEHERPAMQVVEGYCNARWRPLKGYGPGPLTAGGWGESLLSPQSPEEEPSPTPAEPPVGAQESAQRSWWRRVFGG